MLHCPGESKSGLTHNLGSNGNCTMVKSAHPRLRFRLRIIAVLFALTGAVALLLEQAFEKMLSTLLGCSTPAAATVLGVYFAGLSMGGMAYGHLIRPHASRPLRTYAWLEGGIGLCALLMYLFFDDLIPFFVPLLSLGINHSWLLQFLRIIVAVCWIFPLTFLMGASFPAIVDSLDIMRVPNRGRAMSKFYMINLLGGLLGVFIGLYIFFPKLGVDGTLLAAWGVNSIVCLTAILLAQGLKTYHSEMASGPNPFPVKMPILQGKAKMLLVVSFVSGFLFFALEVLWTHLIGAVMGNSIYAFGTMLAIVLLGLGIGAAAVTRFYPAQEYFTLADFSSVVMAGAAVLALFYGCWSMVPGFFLAVGEYTHTFFRGELVRWAIALLMLLPSTVILGMIYPALFRLDIFPAEERGTVAGRLGAVNAVGCILGALTCGFLLIPYLGSEDTMRFLIVLFGLSALGLCLAFPSVKRRLASILISLMVIVAAIGQGHWNRLMLTSGIHVYFSHAYVSLKTKLLFFHEDTYGGMTTVVENNSDNEVVRTLLTNGKFQGNDSEEMAAQEGFALIPMMFTSAFDDALVIGLGTGNSAHVVEEMGFRSIDIAEIAPGILQAARQFFGHINGGVVDKPNVHLILDDGRNVLLLREKQYDLITMEISSIWFAGSTNLYSSEFYTLAKRRLKPGGVFQQWIQMHHIGKHEILSEISTLRHIFPFVSLWVLGNQGILVASDHEQTIQPVFLERLDHREVLKKDTVTLKNRFKTLLASRLLAPIDVTRISGSCSVLNTDRNRVLEYASPRYNLSRADLYRDNLLDLAKWASFPPPQMSMSADRVLFEVGRQVTRSDYFQSLGLTDPNDTKRH